MFRRNRASLMTLAKWKVSINFAKINISLSEAETTTMLFRDTAPH